MRLGYYLMASALVVAACIGAAGTDPEAREMLAQLQGELATLTARVTALEARHQEPHLVVLSTGRDLGRVITNNIVLDPAIPGPVLVTARAGVAYEQAGCNGAAYLIGWDTFFGDLAIPGPDDTLLQITGPAQRMVIASYRDVLPDGSIDCVDLSGSAAMASPFRDLGIAWRPIAPSALTVRLQ